MKDVVSIIELDVLGPPRLRVDGADPPPDLLWRKHLALLIYLARSQRARTRDHLVGLLWPEKDDSKARHSLNEALRVIRRAVGDSLVTDGENVQLAAAAVRMDTDNLEDIPRPGVFLDGFAVPDAPAFENWVTAEREGLRAVVLDRLVASAERSIADGNLAVGRDAAANALEIEPLHEPAVQLLMRAYALAGGRVLALKAFERFSEAFARDLDLKPSNAIVKLAECIRRERLVAGAPTSAPAEKDIVPMFGVGRKALAACVQYWEKSRAGSPTMVVLRGEPGTGKTRVADEVAARARMDGAVVAFARALDREGPDGIWSALLKGGMAVPELAGAAPQALAALGLLEPDLLALFPAAKKYDPMPDAGEPFRHAAIALAEARPVLLLVDDACKADPSALQALGSIVQRAGHAPICVMLTVSAVPAAAVDYVCQRLGRDLPGGSVDTGAFESPDIRKLVTWAFPEYDEHSTDRLARRVLADTGGNPFLAVEFVRAVQSGLRIRADTPDTVWPAESRTLDQTIPGDLPTTVSAALRIRFQALSRHAQTLLTVVAVLGGNHPLAFLARAAGVTIPDAELALDELEWQRWLVADARGYCFSIGLAKEVVLADMVTGGMIRRIRERAGLA